MTRSRRAVLAVYGVSSALIFLWVPWRGYQYPIYQVPKDRWNSMFLGYGPVWSQLKPPAAFVKYDTENTRYAEYQRLHESDCIEPSPKSGSGQDEVLHFKPTPPPGKQYCIQSPAGVSPQAVPSVQPQVPEGYISSEIYRWATLDYSRVLLEFCTLTALLLVAWMLMSILKKEVS